MDLRSRAFHAKRHVLEFFEDQWFDRTRRVRTSGDVSLQRAGVAPGAERDSEHYVPARPAHIREALQDVPIRDLSPYSYIDLGSGKGRTLFVAAEFPFRRITGVELSAVLHRQACANIESFRYGKKGTRPIQSICADAVEFAFPQEPLVLYLFNPFGRSTMQRVLNTLQASLESKPRHVVVVLLWPRCGDQVERIHGMCLVCTAPHHQIFEVNAITEQTQSHRALPC